MSDQNNRSRNEYHSNRKNEPSYELQNAHSGLFHSSNEELTNRNQRYTNQNASMGSFTPVQSLQFPEQSQQTNMLYNGDDGNNNTINDNERDIYGGFVNHHRQRPPPATAEYNDVFNTNSQQLPSEHQYNNVPSYPLPSINVIQTTPELIHNGSQTMATPIERPFFNENDYYYNNRNSRTSPSIASSSDGYADQEARPILEQPNNNMNSGNIPQYHDQPFGYNNGYHGLQAKDYYDDPEGGYIDQRGDDYQINSYLGRNGEMVDPYDYENSLRHMTPMVRREYLHDDNRPVNDGKEELDSVKSGYSHRDLGEYDKDDFLRDDEYDDLNTIDKLQFQANGVPASSSVSSIGSKESDIIVSNDNLTANRALKRSGTEIRKFKLWNGNFVFDSPISKTLLDQYATTTENANTLPNEFKFMRYQAVTCEPNQLAEKNFTVRQLKYLTPRETELMLVVTMYNEDHILLGRTLKGIMDNVKYMVKKKNSSTWGPDAWKKIVVCIISDGRSKINERSLALLSSLGCYQDGFAKDEINEKKVAMHVYEHTTMINITNISESEVSLECNQGTVPIQLLFCLKEQNQKKINSHRWAFEGFAELLRPNIVTLLDAGTMPGKDSIYQLWREFRNPNVGGACGEIRTDLGKRFVNLLNPLVASQNFEYKMSNILDKTTESNFGFITVLPGAFSAYRFEAVRGQPLQKYFYGEIMENEGFHFFSSNMYLAEDRILCFEVVTKKNCNWILKYCRSSYASTDVPERVPEFILQRRRWLNGSFFASVYSFCHFYRVWSSGHNIGRKLLLTVEFFYLFFNTLISWFSLSSFFLVFRILTVSIALAYHSAFNVLSVIFLWLYGICTLSTFILSLGNKPKSTEKFYVLTCVIFAVMMIYMIFCSIFMSVKSFQNILKNDTISFEGLITTEAFRDIVISLGSTYCLYLISSIIYLQPWHMLTSFIQYILLSPSYINVLNIYAFCNVHDLSWGTKGAMANPLGKINTTEDGTFKMEVLVSSSEIQANYDKYLKVLNDFDPKSESRPTEPSYDEKKTGYYANVRSLVIIFWVITNFIIVAVVLETGGIADYIAMKSISTDDTLETAKKAEIPLMTSKASIYFNVILWLVALSALIRFIGCSIYMIVRFFKKVTFR
ncbi:BDF_1d_G0045140.mRNA.1.CDS.1 [Saccharomyces cerevisiae]|nr:BDF_1d_G0045140.mRNA.1.CDS.1 [Saccharomyces cerevisiae]CAI7304161.1 BDF_1d_G0045140.mRNA.1.CDS.1 [Saccharomyces cerevisiae]